MWEIRIGVGLAELIMPRLSKIDNHMFKIIKKTEKEKIKGKAEREEERAEVDLGAVSTAKPEGGGEL